MASASGISHLPSDLLSSLSSSEGLDISTLPGLRETSSQLRQMTDASLSVQKPENTLDPLKIRQMLKLGNISVMV